jgi:hypothetical protein
MLSFIIASALWRKAKIFHGKDHEDITCVQYVVDVVEMLNDWITFRERMIRNTINQGLHEFSHI